MAKKKVASPKEEAPKKETKTKEPKPKSPAPAKKVEAEVEVKVPKAYRRAEGSKQLPILRHEEILLNGRKCHRVELVDGTSDIVPEADLQRQLVW